jgi:hypothetical protein
MEAKLTISQSPQMLAGDAVRPAVPTLRKLTSILAARPRPMCLLRASFPLAGLAASILAPTADGITQTVQLPHSFLEREGGVPHIPDSLVTSPFPCQLRGKASDATSPAFAGERLLTGV